MKDLSIYANSFRRVVGVLAGKIGAGYVEEAREWSL